MLKSMRMCLLILLVFVVHADKASCQLASEYLRNGEVYLSISSAPVALGINGMWRLNDPEGFQSPAPVFPQYLFHQSLVQNFAVDINRNIFTLSDPDQSPIGTGFMLKRQVLDNTGLLRPDGSWTHNSRTGTAGTGSLGGVTINNVTNGISDWGCHQFIHADHRNETGRWGWRTDVYRTIENAAATTRNVRASSGNWSGFVARRPNPTTAPSNPLEYLPSGFANNDLILPHYTGKAWYEIPNGAWYSSWKARWCCGTPGYGGGGWNHNSSGGTRGNTNVGINWFYQVFADRAVGTQFDWRLVRHTPNLPSVSNYTSTPGVPFATTYNMAITRASLAGCLDGCGFNSNSGTVSSADMLFHAAFMPFADALGNAQVRTYSYSRTDGTANWNLDVSGGFTNYTTFGNPIGISGVRDTRWIGVSVAPAGRDFLYYMGNSVIRSWLPSLTGLNISAVTVSNQWNQEGGIIFAFDSTSGNVIRFTIDSGSSPAGVVSGFNTISISSILSSIGADASKQVDAIAADGFGNLFLALTYPSPDPNFNVPLALNWTYDDAKGYFLTPNTDGSGVNVNFEFEAPYRKSVWKISAMGQPPQEVGNVEMARRPYTRVAVMSASGAAALPPSTSLPASINGIVASWAVAEFPFDPAPFDWLVAGSRLAVINAPTPPEVISIYGKQSYLDIIGPYKDTIPVPDPINRSTRQNSMARSSGVLDLSQLYFYMVENYPLPGAVQDPRVSSDYDGDGRVSGLVSTVMNANPGDSSPNVRYIWNTWLVWRVNSDINGNPVVEPVIPPSPSNPGETKTSFVHAFYSPVTAGFVITCKVQYDWFDYDQAPFGMTREAWDANPSLGRMYNSWAIPSAPGVSGSGQPNVINTTTRLNQVLDDVFTGYSGSVPMASIRSQMSDTILGTTPFQFYAIEGVVASGTPPPVTPPATESARIQRCNPGAANDPLVQTNWNPSAAGQLNPTQGYHGLNAGTDYRWRLDVASQAVFFDELSETSGLPAYNPLSPHPKYNFYQFLANKLMDPAHPYFINVRNPNPANPADFASGNATLRFLNRGDDIRWAPGSTVAVEAYVDYMTPTSATPVRYNIPTTDFSVVSYVSGGVTHRFSYVTIPGDVLPITDPTVATLTIAIRRGFLVDMYGFGPDGNPLSSAPFYQDHKFLTLTGHTSIMVVDTEAPKIAFSQTSPKQLYGNTGELLNTGGNVSFRLVDNNPWEGASVMPHTHYNSSNVASNKTTVASINNAGQSSQNLRPVFNRANRFTEFSYEISAAAADMSVSIATHSYYPGWGRKVGGLVPGIATTLDLSGFSPPAISPVVDAGTKVFRANFDFVHPVNRLGNDSSALLIPGNYANNSPGYRPYQFYVEAMDSSGNHMPVTRLNLVLHVKDTLPPNPYAIISELKNNSFTRIPSVSTAVVASDGAWIANFANLTAFSSFYNNSSTWQADPNGFIAAYGLNNMTSLPFVNGPSENIVALRTGLFEAGVVNTIVPGDIVIEDNVDVLFRVGAVDNAGVASASLSYRMFDINGNEITRGISMFEAWKSRGVTGTNVSNVEQSRAVFREGTAIRFPIAIPVTIVANDDARGHDSYPNETHTDNFTWSDWGTLNQGGTSSNSRTFKTTLPVYGSELNIRTIERGIRQR